MGLEFHKGIDYAVVMTPKQTTEEPLARLFGRDKDVTKYGNLFAASPDIKDQAQFLLDRLADFEGEIESEELVREWSGHVAPAIARLRDAIAKATGA